MRAEQALMIKLGEAQMEMRPLLTRLADGASGGMDDVSRTHLRNVDVSLNRLVEDGARGHDELLAALRSEFKLLARTIAALAEGNGEPTP